MTKRSLPLACALALVATGTTQALAHGTAPRLAPGDSGRPVKRLQVRVAGWFPGSPRRVHFVLDGRYGEQTKQAVAAFQRHYGLRADGITRPGTWRVLARLTDPNGSTAHFDWSEFEQNRNRACTAQANAYAGTFGGGMVSPSLARNNVRRLMWRLEALRARGRNHALGISSGFRSVPYNDCIGGARASQHMYGTAADNRMALVSNRHERWLAKRTELHGIGCYSTLSHNHLDIRIDNPDLPAARSWWWPRRDARGRDLDESGRICWGEPHSSAKQGLPLTTSERVLGSVRRARPGAGSLLPKPAEVRAFARAGEVAGLGGAD